MITIAIPLFNTDIYKLKQAVDSVCKQTSSNWQLILVDGSPEPLVEIEQWVIQLNHPKITYLKNVTSPGLANNWNYCIEVAKSELVTLLHDDDYLAPQYVEKMLAISEQKRDSAAYFCDVFLVDESNAKKLTMGDFIKSFIKPKSSVYELYGDSGLARLLKGCFIFCPTLCYRKSEIKYVPFNNQWNMVADLQFYSDLLLAGKRITGIQEKLYFYRRHQNAQTSILTQNFVRFEEEVLLYNKLYELTKGKWHRTSQQASGKTILKLHIIYLLMKSICTFNFSYAQKLFLFYRKNFVTE